MQKILLHSLLILSFTFTACTKSKIEPEEKQKYRTVLVYLAANNNLYSEANSNMQQMEEAISNIDGHLIVYAKLKNR